MSLHPRPFVNRLRHPVRPTVVLFGLVAATALAPAPAAAQGEEESDTVASVLDGVFTEEQAAEGETLFAEICVDCHYTEDFTDDLFLRAWVGLPIRSLFKRMRETMPEDAPGMLTAEEYAQVTAYILQLNEYPTGSTPLPGDPEALRGILFEKKPPNGR